MRHTLARLVFLPLFPWLLACSSTDPLAPAQQTETNGGSGGTEPSSAGSANAGSPNGGSATTGGTAGLGGSGESGGASGSNGVAGSAGSGTGGDVNTGGSGGSAGSGGSGGLAPAPLLAILDQFTAPDVPERGPNESPPINRSWTAPQTLPEHPGNGIAEHPMLYAGEGYNTLFLVNGGEVIWSYSTGGGGEIDDVWMMTNGHVLYSRQNYLEEITPKKEVVWRYDAPDGTEVHSLQPIGLDKVLFMQNGVPAKIIVMHKESGNIEAEHDLPDAGTEVHPQFRRVRMTAAGTYLAPYLKENKVVEYDQGFNVIWTYQIPENGSPWAAIRLQNGNTLIQDEVNRAAREVNSAGEIVWEFRQTELPPGLVQGNTQTSDRLANGNTVILSSGRDPNRIQAVEVTPDKQVVWVLQDWQHLGPATTAQFLDQPGIPENPGELQH